MQTFIGLTIIGLSLYGAWQVIRKLFKTAKWLYALVRPAPAQKATGNLSVETAPIAANSAKTPKPMFVGRYDNRSQKELTPWEDLPQYNGAVDRFGFAKYSEVVVPNNRYYPSVCYMDTPLKQYVYDLMAAHKDNVQLWNDMGWIKAWGGFLFFPGAFTLMAWGKPYIVLTIWSLFALFWVSAIFYFGPAGMRAARWSAECSRRLTPADWLEVDLHVMDEMAQKDKVRRAYLRGRMSGGRW